MAESVQVVVRCRPMNTREKNEGCQSIIEIDSDINSVSIKNPLNPKEEPKRFTFDASWDESTIQRKFYDDSCSELIENVLKGFNGTIFACKLSIILLS